MCSLYFCIQIIYLKLTRRLAKLFDKELFLLLTGPYRDEQEQEPLLNVKSRTCAITINF